MKYFYSTAAALLTCLTSSAQTATNLGLVGVGRLSPTLFDQRGPNLDSLGGLGSGIFFDAASWSRTGDELSGFTYRGTLYSTPDRGFGDGSEALHPRLQTFSLAITPYYGAGPALQSQIVLSNSATTLFTYDGTNLFTGFDADSLTETNFPASSPGGIGQGLRSIDPEGLARSTDGGWFVCDEYGPFIYKFNSAGNLEYTMQPPAAVLPKNGNYPGAAAFTANTAPTSGRRNNRGLEGLSITPDGKRVMSLLQSPTIQDVGGGNLGRNTRVFVFDVDPASVTFRQPIAEYIYRLTLNATPETNRNTPASELLALNRTQFLVLERDSLGFGNTTTATPLYKRVVLGDLANATNILNTAYDLELGAPGQLSFAANTLPANVAAVTRQDLVDMLDTNQLARFGLNITNFDTNTITEKWEGLTLVPLNDAAAPSDYLLLAANDNDFKSPLVYHNGVIVGTNTQPIDNMFLAYRVTLPTYGAAVPPNKVPSVAFTGPTNATLSAPARVNLAATAYDQDGKVIKVEFFEDAVKLGEATAFPHNLTLNSVPAGTHTYTALATDNNGATAAAIKTVVVTPDNLLPNVTLAGPTNATLSALATVTLTSTASDPDGFVTNVEFYDGLTKVGQKTNAPYTLTLSNVAAAFHDYTAVATDNQGATGNSPVFTVNVTVTNIFPNVTLLTPTNKFTATQAVNIAFTASASDQDGFITKVEYYRGATKLGQATASPYSFTASNFVAGTNIVTARAFDNQGAATDSSERVVIVRDTTPPVIHCSTDRIIECVSTDGTPVTFSTTATDNNDPSVAVVCTPASGTLFTPGTNLVTCTATDAAGNASSCSFKVIVLPSLVTIEPAIIVHWNCAEMLQYADNVNGPWTDLAGATNPYVVPASEARRFYRVRGLP